MKLKIGKRNYAVVAVPKLDSPYTTGRINYVYATINIATTRFGKPRSAKAQHATLWHELVHGMLHDMNSRKANDEAFVGGLADRIVSLNNQLQEYANGKT
jgi:hypothetical protein